MPAPPIPLSLKVNRVELARGIRLLQKAEASARHRATVYFEDGFLNICLGEVTIRARGTGTWAGEIRLLARHFQQLFINTEAGPEVVDVGLNKDGFFAGGLSAPCTWRRSRSGRQANHPAASPPG